LMLLHFGTLGGFDKVGCTRERGIALYLTSQPLKQDFSVRLLREIEGERLVARLICSRLF
jgi:hypothetical protein